MTEDRDLRGGAGRCGGGGELLPAAHQLRRGSGSARREPLGRRAAAEQREGADTQVSSTPAANAALSSGARGEGLAAAAPSRRTRSRWPSGTGTIAVFSSTRYAGRLLTRTLPPRAGVFTVARTASVGGQSDATPVPSLTAFYGLQLRPRAPLGPKPSVLRTGCPEPKGRSTLEIDRPSGRRRCCASARAPASSLAPSPSRATRAASAAGRHARSCACAIAFASLCGGSDGTHKVNSLRHRWK